MPIICAEWESQRSRHLGGHFTGACRAGLIADTYGEPTMFGLAALLVVAASMAWIGLEYEYIMVQRTLRPLNPTPDIPRARETVAEDRDGS